MFSLLKYTSDQADHGSQSVEDYLLISISSLMGQPRCAEVLKQSWKNRWLSYPGLTDASSAGERTPNEQREVPPRGSFVRGSEIDIVEKDEITNMFYAK